MPTSRWTIRPPTACDAVLRGGSSTCTAPSCTRYAYRASEWVEHNVDAFCAGYASAAGADPRDDAALLRALVTEKAVYEVVYESRMRPSWVVLPLGAVERLAG